MRPTRKGQKEKNDKKENKGRENRLHKSVYCSNHVNGWPSGLAALMGLKAMSELGFKLPEQRYQDTCTGALQHPDRTDVTLILVFYTSPILLEYKFSISCSSRPLFHIFLWFLIFQYQ